MAEITRSGTCAVCGASDARMLVMLELRGGAAVTLCGSHALLHSRTGEQATSVSQLRSLLKDRRTTNRRDPSIGDELGERLTQAFMKERRGPERRAV